MLFKEKIQGLIKYRVTLHPDDDYETNKVWEEIIEAHNTYPMNEILSFIKNEATDKDIYWISEIFDDLFIDASSKKLYQAYYERASRILDKKILDDVMDELELHKDLY